MAVARLQRDHGFDMGAIDMEAGDPYAVAQPIQPPQPIMPQGSNQPSQSQPTSQPLVPPAYSKGAQQAPIQPPTTVKPAALTIQQPSVSLRTPTGGQVTLPGLPPPITDMGSQPRGSLRAPQYQGGGVDIIKWMDPNHSTPKYDVLRLADNYNPMQLGRAGLLNPSAGSLRSALQDMGFTIVDEDQIFRQDVGTVDILHGDRTEWGWNVGGAKKPPKLPKPPKPPKINPPVNPPGPPNLPPGVELPPPEPRPTEPGFIELINTLVQGPRLESGYAPPGNPGVFDDDFVQQIGNDPLSQLITAGLAGLIEEGGTPLSSDIEGTLRGIISRGGALPNDSNNRNLRFESARELMEKGRRTMMNDTRGELARRNLLSEPGIPQGQEISAVRRIEEAIAPEFARELRNISIEENQANDKRLSESLSLATGMAQNQAQVMIQALGSATERQQALADISLGVLDRNITWNKFLAEHGLNREKILNEIQQGRLTAMVPILNSFIQWLSIIRGGYIGPDSNSTPSGPRNQ